MLMYCQACLMLQEQLLVAGCTIIDSMPVDDNELYWIIISIQDAKLLPSVSSFR